MKAIANLHRHAGAMMIGALIATGTLVMSPLFTLSSQAQQVAPQQDKRKKITEAELPEAVKKTLKGEAYKGWVVSSAFVVDAPTGLAKEYEVELKKGQELMTVKLDNEGKVK